MRLGRFGCRALAVGVGVVGWLLAAPAMAAPLVFPTNQTLVPVAVATAFVLPALFAALYVLARRILWALGPIGAIGMLVIVTLALTGYLNPGLIAALRI